MRLYLIPVLLIMSCISVTAIPFPWLPVDSLPTDLKTIESDYVQGKVFFTITESGELYKTTDSGDSWNCLATPGGNSIILLRRNPIFEKTWYSVTVSGTAYDLWYSENNGDTWSHRCELPGQVVNLSPSPMAEGILLGVFGDPGDPEVSLKKSEDGGVSWHEVLSVTYSGIAPIWHVTSSWQINWGQYASFDYGETWKSVSTKPVTACGFDVPSSLFSPTQDGLFRSRDNLITWWPLLLENVTFITLNPRNKNQLMTGNPNDSSNPILYYSSDAGESFSNWTAGINGRIDYVSMVSDWMFFVIVDGILYRYDERPADMDGSRRVDGGDLVILSTAFGTFTGDPGFNEKADLNHDGVIDGNDLVILSSVFGHRFYYDENDEPGDFPGLPE
ncbi:hypothetical protein K8T06_05600 [bacterium]|nr:hypothetical protein [bacterium]